MNAQRKNICENEVMKKRFLITGICGFTGRYMCDYLNSIQPRPEVIGVDVRDGPPSSCGSFYMMDLASADDVSELIKQSKPDYIIHLAGTFGTKDSQEIYKVNVLSITALLEAVREYAPDAVLIAAGSAAEYGCISPHQLPVDEETFCRPVVPYGLSKHLATQIGMYYHRVHGICAMIVRPFQLIGKGVSSHLAPGAFVEQLKQIIATGSRVIKVGNLESSRDFLDVHDAVEAIWALCQKPVSGQIFNICSGKPVKMADLLQMMIDHCGVEVKIEIDPCRLRGTADASIVYGSCQKIMLHSGWKPKTALSKSLAAMFA